MNRGQLEALAVRLYMLAMRNRLLKSAKPEAMRRMKIEVTRWSEAYLVEYIFREVEQLEVM